MKPRTFALASSGECANLVRARMHLTDPDPSSGVKSKYQWVNRKNTIVELGIFLLFFVILTAILLLSLLALDLVDARIQVEQGRVRALAATERGVNRAEAFVKAAASDIHIVAQSRAVCDFVAGDTSKFSAVASEFETFILEKPAITQLRLLDLTGQETLRVDTFDGKAVAVAPGALQDKSARYYFKNAVTLPPKGIYLSALDLNVEHGVVQQPWLPVLRLAVPVLLPDGDTGGVVVMNLDAGGLIADVAKMRSEGSGTLALLNQAGFWLAGAPQEKLWGFMFGNDETLARTDPGLWSRIVATGTGEFSHDGRLYVVQTMRPS